MEIERRYRPDPARQVRALARLLAEAPPSKREGAERREREEREARLRGAMPRPAKM